MLIDRSLQANVIAGNLRISTGENTFVDTDDRASMTERGRLVEKCKEQALGVATSTQAIGAFVPNKLPFDPSSEPAYLTTAHVLESMSENMDIGAGAPLLFQMNAVYVETPQEGMTTSDGARLFFLARVSDFSGSCCGLQ